MHNLEEETYKFMKTIAEKEKCIDLYFGLLEIGIL